MDEFSSGMDPEMKRYFKRIIQSFSVGLLWMLGIATAGIFFQLGFVNNGIRWYNVLFYLVFIISLVLLILYLYKTWSKKI